MSDAGLSAVSRRTKANAISPATVATAMPMASGICVPSSIPAIAAPASAPEPSCTTPTSEDTAPAIRGNGDSAPAMANGRMRAKAKMLTKSGRATAYGLVAPVSAGTATAIPIRHRPMDELARRHADDEQAELDGGETGAQPRRHFLRRRQGDVDHRRVDGDDEPEKQGKENPFQSGHAAVSSLEGNPDAANAASTSSTGALVAASSSRI